MHRFAYLLLCLSTLSPSFGAEPASTAKLKQRLLAFVPDPDAPDLGDAIRDFKALVSSPSFTPVERQLALRKLIVLTHLHLDSIRALEELATTLPEPLRTHADKGANYAYEMLSFRSAEMPPRGAKGFFGESAMQAIRARADEGSARAQRALGSLSRVPGLGPPTAAHVSRAYVEVRLEFIEDILRDLRHDLPPDHLRVLRTEAVSELKSLVLWQDALNVTPEQRIPLETRLKAVKFLGYLAEIDVEAMQALDDVLESEHLRTSNGPIERSVRSTVRNNAESLERKARSELITDRVFALKALKTRTAAGSDAARRALISLAIEPLNPEVWRPAQAALLELSQTVPTVPTISPNVVQLTLERGATAIRTGSITSETIEAWLRLSRDSASAVSTLKSRQLALQQWMEASLSSDEARKALQEFAWSVRKQNPKLFQEISEVIEGYFASLPPNTRSPTFQLRAVRVAIGMKNVPNQILPPLSELIRTNAPEAREAISLLMQASLHNPSAAKLLNELSEGPIASELMGPLSEATRAIHHGFVDAQVCIQRFRSPMSILIPPERRLTFRPARGSP